ncbi:transglycosylase family protein [Kitasatospora sp. NBC_01302]|nr:transglycosylase family protein [Kitasatospora sp. NBC_01302]
MACAGSASAASVSTWEKVAQCESSGNWSINTGNGYYGGLQFAESTWLAYHGDMYAQYPYQATEQQQILIAEQVLRSAGPSQWSCAAQAGLTNDGVDPYPAPTVPSAAVNTVHLVDLTPDGGLHNTEGNYSGGGWTSWNDMGASSIKDVTSASTGSTNRVFAISSTNQIWEKDGNYATGQWSGWFQPISDGHTFTAISASSSGNTVHLAAIGTDGQMYNADGAFPNGGWTSWSAHGGTNLKHIASASTSDNVNHIFVVDSGNQLREIDASYATGSWGSWGTPAGGFTGQDVTAAAFGNTVHLDTIGMDGNLYNTEGNYGGSGWGTWSNMGGSGLKRLTSATSAATNVNHIFAINSNNRLTEIDADYNTHSWNTWAEPAGGADSIGLTADFTS